MAAGKAAQRATVVAGDARFEVLTPEVVRLEYSPTGSFLDLPTFNVLDRDFPVPAYTESARGGWIYLATTDLVLRYQLGSGPFNPTNTQVQLLHPLSGTASVVAPSWEWECTFGQVCQSGAATLAGGAALSTGQANYQSPAGFITGYSAAGASATWQLLGAPAGNATVTLRYANGTGGGRTMSLVVNGTTTQVTLPPTPSWDDWATLSEPVALPAGSNTVALSLW
jgi:hypothetical protein